MRGACRCVIPAEGYYMSAKKKNLKGLYFVTRKDRHLLLMAGLCAPSYVNGRWTPTFSVITTKLLKSHALYQYNKFQPVLLPDRAALATWLNTSSETWTTAHANIILHPTYDETTLQWYEVSRKVEKGGPDSATLIEPVHGNLDPIPTFLRRQAALQDKKAPSPSVIDLTRDDDEEPSAAPEPKKACINSNVEAVPSSVRKDRSTKSLAQRNRHRPSPSSL
ncbi:hypothetical protein H1R20_g13022, partial [Candolleomyces eurysporus]